MRKLRVRKGSWLLAPILILSFFSSPVNAESFRTESAGDFYFQLESGTTFTVRAHAQQYGIDSMFWLYNSNNTLLVSNDDFFGLDSYISYNVQESGTYRLRTGVCCGDPNRWYGNFYNFETDSVPTNAPPTTTSSTTTTSTTTTTTTTLPPLGMRTPTNLQAIAYEGSVFLSWDEPEGGEGYAPVERYAIFFTDDNWQTSRAIGSTSTSATVYNLENGTEYQFRVRADNDTLGVYSSTVETFTVSATPFTTTTTSTTTTTTTTTIVEEVVPPPVETLPTENTTVSIPELDPTPVSTPEIDTSPVVVPEPENLPNETIPEVSIPEETQTTADEAVANIFNNSNNADELGAAVTDAIGNAESPEEIAALVTSLFDGPMNSEEFSAVVDSIFTENLSTEELSAVLDAVFSEPLSDEKFADVIDAVLDSPLTNEQFAEVVEILESDNVSEDQVSDAVDNILENGVTEDQATDLATSAKVLESIDANQATEIFQEIPVSDLTAEEEAALVETLTDAPTEIKEAFEGAIDIFGEGLDDYVPTGSEIDVEARRALIAVTTVLTTITTAPMPSGGSSAPSGGGAGGPSGGGGSGNGDRGSSRSRRK